MAKKASKKKRKMPERFGKEKPVAEAAPNPFELLHSRKKFDVLGQKKKGAAKKITRSRNEAMSKVEPRPLLPVWRLDLSERRLQSAPTHGLSTLTITCVSRCRAEGQHAAGGVQTAAEGKYVP